VTFERTRDRELIKRVLTDEAIYPHIGDDDAPEPEAFEPQSDPRVWWVLARDGGEILGLFLFLPQSRVCFECHVSMLPAARKRGIAAGRAVIPWFCGQTGCRRLVATIAETNPRAIRYAQACGFRVMGRNERSWIKGGKLVDQVYLGLSFKGVSE
jgi:RimJ/RimL family protein N-acetyltransferase